MYKPVSAEHRVLQGNRRSGHSLLRANEFLEVNCMTKLVLIAGVAAMLGAAPALAEKGGKGHGPKAHATHGVKHGNAAKHDMKAAKGNIVHRAMRDRDRDGLDDRDEALARKYGGALCPPGLAKKTPACMAPGQAKRAFREGQRLPSQYRYYTPYSDIPLVLRNQYNLDDDYRYIYRNNVIYQVDPQTRLIRDIIDAIL
jgi:hypothetical protein